MYRKLFFLCVFLLLPGGVSAKGTNTTPRPHHHKGFSKAGVVTNSETCTNIALDILDDDGSAVDAAIAGLLCEGITNPQSMGIGGGFLMTIYDSSEQKVHVLNAREVAPAAATKDMFGPADNTTTQNNNAIGGLSVAIPGELMGYWEAHKRFGKVGWYDLFRPSIDIATKGLPVSHYTATMIERSQDDINTSPSLKKLLTNPTTSLLYGPGEIMKRPMLAATLELVATNGPTALYNGTLTEHFLQDIDNNGGIITSEDLKNYEAVWQQPIEHSIGKYVLYSAGKPGSGELLMYILEVMTNKLCNHDVHFWHHIIESWKYAFALKAEFSGGRLGEQKPSQIDAHILEKILTGIHDGCTSNNAKDYLRNDVPIPSAQDHGTSQICVYTPNGDAVSVTSTINLSFGAMFVSESTGIILNNEMMDFASPDYSKFKSDQMANQIKPLHYPMSTMLPTIVLDPETKSVRLVIGAAGGFKILTAASIVTLENLYMGMPLKTAIATKRLHHQLKPMVVEFEEGFDEEILEQLQKIGHVLQPLSEFDETNNTSGMGTFSCVNGISIINGHIYPVGDKRRKSYAGGL